ncbi:Zn-dependent alcohol dehydrogenase [Leucobacter triazinivorans]|uniref:Zn-dependent alcohol dehydrogenase n=1 Tax=Leucobacter triazinivorans TaxID=1784719 RepID=A0A4P6KER3_9MICO|nr:Zn-dependent alcohol dehydrogenase [Leucobacter triazinivorans]QBE48428.1 Zn-dependent alcohol dehydrogenase [Leucobacter triazinivorans]
MKAAVLHSVGAPFTVEDVVLAAPLGREVRVDVRASGLCHSDRHVQLEGLGMPFPSVLGHEISGVVAEIGPDVTELAPGDHVVAYLVSHCGRCRDCIAGEPFRCANTDYVRRSPEQGPRITRRNGEELAQVVDISGFAEQVLVHENNLVKVNDEIPFDRACLLGCGVITGAGAAINTAQVRVGDTVAVIGAGGVGLNVVQGARIAGASRIIAIDLQDEKLELARRFGATHTINSGSVDDVVAAVAEIAGTAGVDHSFEVIGLVPTVRLALDVLRPGGTAYAIGLQKPGAQLALDGAPDLFPLQKSLKGVFMGSTNPKRDIPVYADLYLQGRLNLDDLIHNHISLDGINEAYEELEGGKVARSIIVFD